MLVFGHSYCLYSDDSLLYRVVNNVNDSKTLQDLGCPGTVGKDMAHDLHCCQEIHDTNIT